MWGPRLHDTPGGTRQSDDAVSFGGGKAPTKAEAARMLAIREAGCIASRIRGLGFVPCTVHHLTVGGRHGQKRRGHMMTVGLSEWHHLGRVPEGWTKDRARQVLGPSYALEPRAFREEFGDDDRLLAYQEELLRGPSW